MKTKHWLNLNVITYNETVAKLCENKTTVSACRKYNLKIKQQSVDHLTGNGRIRIQSKLREVELVLKIDLEIKLRLIPKLWSSA